MKNSQSKIKPKKIGTTYCLGCQDYTDNFKSQEIKMTNKVLREKSNCVVCRSSKSRFSKKNTQQHNNNFSNNINRQIGFTNYKTCISIVKAVKNTRVTHFQNN